MILLFGRLIQLMGTFINYRLLVGFFEANEFGELNLFITFSSLLILIFIAPFGIQISRLCKEWERENVLSNNLLIIFFLCSVGSMVGCLIAFILVSITSYSSLFLIAGVYCFSLGLANTMPSLVAINNSILKALVLSNIQIYGGIIFSLIFINFFEYSIIYWIYGQIVIQIILIFFVLQRYSAFKSKLQFTRIIKFLNLHISFLKHLPLISILIWLAFSMPRFYIESRYGADYFGIFIAGYILAFYLMAGIEQINLTLIYPKFYRETGSENADEKVKSYSIFFKYLFSTSLIFLAIVFTWKYWIEKFLLPDYENIMNYFIFGLICEFFRIISTSITNASHLRMIPKETIIPLLASVCFSLLILLTEKYLLFFIIPVSFLAPIVIYLLSKQNFKLLKLNSIVSDLFKIIALSCTAIMFSEIIEKYLTQPFLLTVLQVLITISLVFYAKKILLPTKSFKELLKFTD